MFQAVLSQLNDYLYTYHCWRAESGSKDGENSEDTSDLEYTQWQHFSDGDDVTQLPVPPYNLPA